jgi:hypothetical protein
VLELLPEAARIEAEKLTLDGQARLIRARETVGDLLRFDR